MPRSIPLRCKRLCAGRHQASPKRATAVALALFDCRPCGCRRKATVDVSQRRTDSLMHHDPRRRTHPYARIEDMEPIGAFGVEAVQPGGGTQTGHDRLPNRQVKRGQHASCIGLMAGIDAVTYPNKLAGLDKSGQACARHHSQKLGGRRQPATVEEHAFDVHSCKHAAKRAIQVVRRPRDVDSSATVDTTTRRKSTQHAQELGAFVSARRNVRASCGCGTGNTGPGRRRPSPPSPPGIPTSKSARA